MEEREKILQQLINYFSNEQKMDRNSIKVLKEIGIMIHEIESKKNQLDTKLTVFSVFGLFEDARKNNPYKLVREFIESFNVRGVYHFDLKEIRVYADYNLVSNRIFKKKHELLKFILTMYHELQHAKQGNEIKSVKNQESLFLQIEDYIHLYDYDWYIDNHQSFFMEMEAEYIGILKTEETAKQTPDFYQKEKRYIDRIKERYQYRFHLYDFDYIVDKAIHMLKQYKNLPPNSLWMKIALARDNTNFIFKEESFKQLDNQSKYHIITNHHVLDRLDFRDLNGEEMNLVISAIENKKENLERKIGIVEDAFRNNKISSVDRETNLTSFSKQLKHLQSIEKKSDGSSNGLSLGEYDNGWIRY